MPISLLGLNPQAICGTDRLMSFFEKLMLPLEDSTSRLFHLNLLMAALMTTFWLVHRLNKSRSHPRPFSVYVQLITRLFFDRRYWWNASTKVDYAIYLLNGLLKVAIFIPFLDFSFWFGRHTIRILHMVFGDVAHWPNQPAYLFAFSFVVFVWDDFLRFAHHLAMHRVPLLWRWHQVHHSATTLTPVTLFRTHPVESAMATVRNSLSLGVASGVFVYLFSGSLNLWTILGVNGFGFLFNLFGANLRHSHIPISFGFFESVLISPKQHQIHHSMDPQHFGQNLGVTLSIWDRLTGTWRSSRGVASLQFGLVNIEAGSLRKLLVGDRN